MKKYDKLLKESLQKNNVLSEQELNICANEAQSKGKTLKEYLLRKSIVTEKQILIALSQTLYFETIDLMSEVIDKDLLERVPVKIAWYYRFIPVGLENNILTIAASDPFDIKVQDEIRLHLGFQIKVVLTTERELLEVMKKNYGLASDTIDRIMTRDSNRMENSASDEQIEDLDKDSEDPTVARLVNEIILEAYQKRATDIHIEPYRNKVRIRYRIDGVMIDANLPPKVKHLLRPILSRIKIMANLSITEKRLPQDGSAVVKTKEQQLDLRISTIPTPRGESMVIRILPSKVMLFSLEKLGFNPTSVEKFRYLIRKPHGIIFLTGPTGSGKTTTLYACLNEINSSERKTITIEDPVEYEMEGITQVQINPKVNFNFSTGLRSLLRHDPDIIMVGEVRDLETAEIAIRTALTGHLVFSSLHTNDAASGITRLIDMGVEPYLVASSVEAFVGQRLVRVICPKCKQEDKGVTPGIKQELMTSLDMTDESQVKFYRGLGCDHCNNTGYYGRMAVYEILLMDDNIRAMMLEKPRSESIKAIAMQQGMSSLRQNGWKAVLDGITTYEEVLNVTVKDKPIALEEKKSKDQPKALKTPSEYRFIKLKKPKDSTPKNFDSRIYPRAYDPVEIRYQLTKRDPMNPENIVTDGVEYKGVSEDISAGGMSFVSKVLLPAGSILDIRINIGKENQIIQCLAKVSRIEEDSLSNVYTIVCYYLDISSSDRTLINYFVKSSCAVERSAKTS